MKILTQSILIAAVFLITSCADPTVGRIVNERANYHQIDVTTTQAVILKHMLLNYDICFDDNRERITFDGNISINKNGFSDTWEVSEIMLKFHFMDENRKIVATEVMRIYPDSFAMELINFKESFNYSEDFKYVIYSYEAKALL